jgi:hypothetical protein
MKKSMHTRNLIVVSLVGGSHRTITLTEEHIRTELGVEPPEEGALVDDPHFVTLVLDRLDSDPGRVTKSRDASDPFTTSAPKVTVTNRLAGETTGPDDTPAVVA